MAYETSYDTGLRPFNHDKNRGKWSSPTDFFFVCLGHAFKMDAMFVMPAMMFFDVGIYTLIPFLLTMALCIVPIVFMQSFLGQFSSTGFLSVFRISPLFKGIGYVSLFINITTLTYFSVLGAIPLFYFFNTLRPTIPWSCEGSKEWMVLDEDSTSVCLRNISSNSTRTMAIPSVQFFKQELETLGMHHRVHPEGRFSWMLMICTFLIWGVVAVIAIKPIENIGKFLRYSCIAVVGIMGLCLLRFLFLPGVHTTYIDMVKPKWYSVESLIMVPAMAFAALGPGWGSVLTMASYNKFDTNIFRYSWLLCAAQMGVMIGVGLLSMLITNFMFSEDPENLYLEFIHSQWMEFLIIPTGLTFLELPHFWSFLFFTMVVLGCLNLLIVQLVSVLTSLFDEFDVLRASKREVTLATIGVLALVSIFFCSNYGVTTFEAIAQFSMMSQMILNLLLLIVVVWVYGRERFQRDVNFMTNRTYSTWMVNIIRYAAPIFLLLAWVTVAGYGTLYLYKSRLYFFSFLLVALLPWCCIPAYCVFKSIQTTGFLGNRLRRLARPTDWYPVDPADRRRYEERFSDTEISHNLTTENVEQNGLNDVFLS